MKVLPRVVGTLALLVCAGFVVPVGVSPAGGDAAGELAGVVSRCVQARAGQPDNIPDIQLSLYNLPDGASPTVTGTISSGPQSSALALSGQPIANTYAPGVYWTFINLPPWAVPGQAFWISMSWSDGLGGGGSHDQLIGVGCKGTLSPPDVPASSPHTAMAATADGTGYWGMRYNEVVASRNTFNYGDLAFAPINAPVVGIAASPDGEGYWLAGADGGVFNYGSATFHGSAGGTSLNAPIVGIAATLDGAGYWLVASDGGVFSYGDAVFHGSMGGQHLNASIVGMAVDRVTGGYWLVGADGGVFAFDAPFHGSAGSLALRAPVVGMEASPDASGYRLAGSDGGVFCYNLPYAGSWSGRGDSYPMAAITGQGSTGYWLMDSGGFVYAFGSAPYLGGA